MARNETIQRAATLAAGALLATSCSFASEDPTSVTSTPNSEATMGVMVETAVAQALKTLETKQPRAANSATSTDILTLTEKPVHTPAPVTATTRNTETPKDTATPTATPSHTDTPTTTPTLTEVLTATATLTPTISPESLASAYAWAVDQKIGHLEDGVLVLNAREFRRVLEQWLKTFGKNTSGDRANITVEMLSKEFGEAGMSTSHALDFWKTEGGRGWKEEDAAHVYSFDELSFTDTDQKNLFSMRQIKEGENEFRIGVVARAEDVKIVVMRLLVERQLRIAQLQGGTLAAILKYLSESGVEQNLRNQAMGLLKSVGIKLSPKDMVAPLDAFRLRKQDKISNFSLRITRGGKADSRANQPETAECVVYSKDLEKQSKENNEDMRHSDAQGMVLITLTEGANGKVVVDIIRLTNIKDVEKNLVTPLADDQANKQVEGDGGRWISDCNPGASTLTPTATYEVQKAVSPTGTPVLFITATSTPGQGMTPTLFVTLPQPSQTARPTLTPEWTSTTFKPTATIESITVTPRVTIPVTNRSTIAPTSTVQPPEATRTPMGTVPPTGEASVTPALTLPPAPTGTPTPLLGMGQEQRAVVMNYDRQKLAKDAAKVDKNLGFVSRVNKDSNLKLRQRRA